MPFRVGASIPLLTIQPLEETIELLNSYYTLMFDAISGQGGVVNQMIGDGLMAMFGAPLPLPDTALAAARWAQDMMELVELFNIIACNSLLGAMLGRLPSMSSSCIAEKCSSILASDSFIHVRIGRSGWFAGTKSYSLIVEKSRSLYPSLPHIVVPRCARHRDCRSTAKVLQQPANREAARDGAFLPTAEVWINLFDHVIRLGKQKRWDREAECFGGLKVDRKFEVHRVLNWKLANFGAPEDPVDISSRAPVVIMLIVAVGQKATKFRVVTKRIDGRKTVVSR
jgi:hypothetical protein